MGYKLITKDNYYSIPGLKLWIGGQSPAMLNSSNEILSMQDMSTLEKIYYSANNRRPTLGINGDFKYIKSVSPVENQQQRLVHGITHDDYAFMYNGIGKFGHFSIIDLATDVTYVESPQELFHCFGVSSSATNVGYNCRYRYDTNQWNFRIFNGTNTSLTHSVNRNVRNQAELLQHIYRGKDAMGNDSEVYINKTFISSVETSANPFSTERGVTVQLYRSQDTSGGEGRGYVTLFYDWTEYSNEQIELFRQRVEKLIYEQYRSILPEL